MVSEAEISRLNVTTDTGNGSYDEILAISQTAVNKGFENLFNVYPELQTMSYHDNSIGSINATLLPPKIVIPALNGTNTKTVYFQLAFDDGQLINNNKDILVDSLKNWIFTIQCDLSKGAVTNPDSLNNIKNTFDIVTGDYSIERLYAELSSANWGSPIETLSQAGFDDEGKPKSISKWKRDNVKAGNKLQYFLISWAGDMQESSLNVLGLEFKLKDVESLGGSPPTYEPTDSNQQVYPFKAIKDGQYYYPENDGSDLVKGDGRNCLLFAEKVQKRPMPGNVWVTWSGNFAPDDTTKDGTFLLNHEIFIQQYLLPAFQQLNRASEILHKKNQTFWQDNNDMVRYSTPYTVGKNSDHPKPEDAFYSFKPEYAAGSTYKVLKYTWTSENGPFTSDVQTFRTCKTKGTVHDINKTEVTWKPGDNKVLITCSTKSFEHGIWTKSPDSDDWNNPSSELNDEYDVDWTVTINIKKAEDTDQLQGALTITVDEDVPCKVNYIPKHTNIDDNGHAEQIQGFLRDNISKKISGVAQACAARLQGTGKFVYPGNGTLVFSNPQFSNWGDLLADVTYKPIQPGDVIVIPPPPDTGDKDPGDDGGHDGDPHHHAPPPTQLQLTWDVTNELKAGTPDDLVFTGTNNLKDPIYFDSIRLIFTSGGQVMDIFTADDFKADGDKAGAASESSAEAPKGPPREDPDPTSAKLDYSNDIITTTPKLDIRKATADESRGLSGKFTGWAAVIGAADEKTLFTIPPGGWVKVTLGGPVEGARRGLHVLVREYWKYDDGEVSGDQSKVYNVSVKP